jgi:hypothetical protein
VVRRCAHTPCLARVRACVTVVRVAAWCVVFAGGKLCGSSNLVGFTYPAYQSFRALETRTNAEDDKKWCVALRAVAADGVPMYGVRL